MKVAAAPAASRRKLLDALVARGTQPRATKEHAAIARDVTLHLATPSPGKPFAELEPMFAAAKDDRTRGRVLTAIGTGADPAAKPFMIELVKSIAAGTTKVERGDAYGAIGAYFAVVPDPATLGLIARHFAAAKAEGHDRWELTMLLVGHADASHAADMLAALRTTSDEEAGRFVDYFARFRSPEATREIRKRIGKAFETAHFELVIGIAGMGDPDVVAWATRKLATKAGDDRWIQVFAIARSPLPAADRVAGKIISEHGPDLALLIGGYAQAHHPNVERRLAALGKGTLSAEAAEALQQTRDARRGAQP
ncbi:MAG: hypothetical protein WKG01_01405 [Kofleriaceae bacterium]